MSKTLIAYETYFGSTRKAAQEIAKILKNKYNIDVELRDLSKSDKKIDMNQYSNAIIGSCIYNGKWAGHANDFLKNDFSNKKIALFVCSMFAGEEKLYNQAHRNYLEEKIGEYPHLHNTVVSMEAFGGKVPRNDYPKQWYKHVASKLPKFTTNNYDISKVQAWANKLGKVLTEE